MGREKTQPKAFFLWLMWTKQQCAVSVWGKPGPGQGSSGKGSQQQLGASLAFLVDTPTWEICPEAYRVLLTQCQHTWFGWEEWWWKESWWKDRSNHKYQLEMWLKSQKLYCKHYVGRKKCFCQLTLVDAFVKPCCYIKCISVSTNCFYSCTNEQPLQCWNLPHFTGVCLPLQASLPCSLRHLCNPARLEPWALSLTHLCKGVTSL